MLDMSACMCGGWKQKALNCFFIQYHVEPFHFPTGQLLYYCNNTLAFIAFYLFSDVNYMFYIPYVN